MNPSVKDYIEYFRLQPHPEGGYYARTYQSGIVLEQSALPGNFNGSRLLSTAICYLLEQGDFSAFHRLKSDECWHYYAGGPLKVFIIEEDGSINEILLGNNVLRHEQPQMVIRAGKWFAATPAENVAFTLVGCTVSPGFDFADLELASREALISLYPAHKTIIEQLTR